MFITFFCHVRIFKTPKFLQDVCSGTVNNIEKRERKRDKIQFKGTICAKGGEQ